MACLEICSFINCLQGEIYYIEGFSARFIKTSRRAINLLRTSLKADPYWGLPRDALMWSGLFGLLNFGRICNLLHLKLSCFHLFVEAFESWFFSIDINLILAYDVEGNDLWGQNREQALIRQRTASFSVLATWILFSGSQYLYTPKVSLQHTKNSKMRSKVTSVFWGWLTFFF